MNPHQETTTYPSSTMPHTNTTSTLPSVANPPTSTTGQTYDNTAHAHTHPHTSDSNSAQNPLPATAHGQTYDPTIKAYQLEDRDTLTTHSTHNNLNASHTNPSHIHPSHDHTHNTGTHISHSPSVTNTHIHDNGTHTYGNRRDSVEDGTHNHNYSHTSATESTKLTPTEVVNLGYPREHKNHHYLIGKHADEDKHGNHLSNTTNSEEGRHAVHQNQEGAHVMDGHRVGHEHVRKTSLDARNRDDEIEHEQVHNIIPENHEHKHHHYLIGDKHEKEATHTDHTHQNTTTTGQAGSNHAVHERASNSSDLAANQQAADDSYLAHQQKESSVVNRQDGGRRSVDGEKKITSVDVVNVGYPREGHQHYQSPENAHPGTEVRK